MSKPSSLEQRRGGVRRPNLYRKGKGNKQNTNQRTNPRPDRLMTNLKSFDLLKSVDWDKQPIRSHVHRFPGLIVPDRLFTYLAYNFADYSLISSSTSGTLLIAGNSPYDPDKSGTGHQPLGYDQYSAFYQRYRVHKCGINLEVTSATIAAQIAVVPTTDGAEPSSLTVAKETPYCLYLPISSSVQGIQLIRDMEISTKTIWGMSSITQDDLYQAVVTTDPARLWYWKVLAGVFDGVTSGSLRVNIRVIYHVEFFDRDILGQSDPEHNFYINQEYRLKRDKRLELEKQFQSLDEET